MNRAIKLVPNKESITQALDFIEQNCIDHKIPFGLINKMSVALDEMYSNVVNYSGATEASVEIIINDDRIEIVIIDNGIEYNPLLKEDPDVTLSAEERPIGGLGIYMTKKMMDSIEYEYINKRNIVKLVKRV